VNDKLYFWLLKPAATGYKYAVNEDLRGIFSNFYENLKAPIRIVNNFLQGKPGYAGIELAPLFHQLHCRRRRPSGLCKELLQHQWP